MQGTMVRHGLTGLSLPLLLGLAGCAGSGEGPVILSREAARSLVTKSHFRCEDANPKVSGGAMTAIVVFDNVKRTATVTTRFVGGFIVTKASEVTWVMQEQVVPSGYRYTAASGTPGTAGPATFEGKKKRATLIRPNSTYDCRWTENLHPPAQPKYGE